MLQQIKRTGSRCLLLVPLGLIVLLFECVPLVSMFVKAFSENGHFSLAQFGTIAHQLVYRTAIINSLWVTLLSTAVGLVMGFCRALAPYGEHGRNKTLYLTSTFAGVPLTIAFITMMGTSGVLVLLGKQLGISLLANYNLYSMTGMFIIYAYFQIPMGTLLLLPTVDKVRREWKEAARLMNAGSIRFWLQVGIPVMMPGILGTFNMLFANAVAAYATPYLLINNSIALLPIKIVDMFVGDTRQRPELGSALSLVLLGIVVLEICLSNLVKRHFEKGNR